MNPREQHFQTRCVHVGVDKDSAYNSATTPIYPTSTFYWDDPETTKGYDYTRSGNPTRRALEENLASLEGGIDCRATCTGMSAVLAALQLFTSGDHLIAGHDIYGGTYRMLADMLPDLGVEVTFVEMGNPDNVRSAIKPTTKGIWIETPSNPLMNIVDIEAITVIAKERDLITIADNTFLSPYYQRPLDLGCDIVLHCNGDLAEMREVASAAAALPAAAAARLDSCPVPAPADMPPPAQRGELQRELAALLGP